MSDKGYKIFPRGQNFRDNWDQTFRDGSNMQKNSENYFEASEEDIEELKTKIAKRCDYAEGIKGI